MSKLPVPRSATKRPADNPPQVSFGQNLPKLNTATQVAAKKLKRRSIARASQPSSTRPPLGPANGRARPPPPPATGASMTAKPLIRSSGYGARTTANPPSLSTSMFAGARRPSADCGPNQTLDVVTRRTSSISSSSRGAGPPLQNMSDMRRRMNVMEQRMQALEGENTVVTASAERETSAKKELEKEIGEWTAKYDESQRQIAELKMSELQAKNELSLKENQLLMLQTRVDDGERQLRLRDSALADLNSAEIRHRAKLSAYEAELEDTKQQLSDAKRTIEDLQQANAEQLETIKANELQFRVMHNQIVDLKGNIRVMCRVRPALSGESSYGKPIEHITFPDAHAEGRCIELDADLNKTSTSTNKLKPTFDFDKAFTWDATQEEVFRETSQLIESSLHGYNVSILAYGQTGSGKTYTMEGAEDAQMGLIPRSVTLLFTTAHSLESLGWKFEFSASFIEIYNEDVYDLLARDPSMAADIKRGKLTIQSTGKDVSLPGLSHHTVGTPEEALRLLKKASRVRSVGATKCNEHSSRSHAIFRMHITANNAQSGKNYDSTLNLIDLAGSERLKDSGATGSRLNETKAINKSLSALKLVITRQLEKKGDSHVPYRDSKLTQLLQHALGAGSSKTLMIVAVSPLLENADETRRSLEFATQASKCQIGQARRY